MSSSDNGRNSVLGTSVTKADAVDKVRGSAAYAQDVRLDNVLEAFVVFSDQPHARMVSLDTSAAELVDGVQCVITANDVPVNEYGLTMFDQPVLVGPGNAGRSAVASDVSRWEADNIAIVVAESKRVAQEAAAKIEVEWEQLPLAASVDAAMAPGAPLIHAEHPSGSNAYHHLVIRKGDPSEIEAAFEAADVVIAGSYELPYQEHAFLQTEAGVAYLDDEGRITIEAAGQWAHEDQEQVAHALDLPLDKVRIIYGPIGGAFGGKEDMSLQIVLALAVKVLADRGVDRPVRAEWTREESIVGHHKRHRGQVTTRWAASADGKILAVEADGYLDAGAYNYTSNKVLGNMHLSVSGPYEIPLAHIDSRAVYTTSVPGGAFRGFGGPQGSFVSECQMNKLAQELGIDPVEIRRRNVLRDGSIGITGTELPPGVSMPEVVDSCSDAANWDHPLPEAQPMAAFASLPPSTAAVRRGRGFACAYKNVGFSFGFPERSEARIVLRNDDDPAGQPASAEVFLAGADVGQGAHTAFVQMTAEATGLPVEAISATFSDTATTGDSGSASASRLSWMTGNAILGAAEEADKAWRDGERPAVGEFRYTPPPTEMLDPEGAPTVPNFSYGYVAEAVDLSVDTETGHIVVHDVVVADDVGRVINPALVTGQIEGAVVQAHGYVLSENLQSEGGRILNPRLSGYLIPGIGDVPEQVRSVLVEVPDPLGPFGVRGMAEMPFIPYAPAIVAALHDATGVWFDSFPLTPPKVRAQLRERGQSTSGE